MRQAIPTFWHRSANFGDCIAPYLVEKITGKKAVYVSNEQDIEHIALIGSLLDCAPLNNTHVWGCGFAHKDSPVYPPKAIYAVRGELSRQKYLDAGIECPEVYGDPALLLPRFYNPVIEKKYRVGIIPHVVDYVSVLENYANKYPDLTIIDLTKPVEEVIGKILECEKTISSSLHGLIVSHAYGIPSLWAEFSNKVLGEGFKFRDYYSITNYNKAIPFNDLIGFPDISTLSVRANLPKININLDKLLESCPI